VILALVVICLRNFLQRFLRSISACLSFCGSYVSLALTYQTDQVLTYRCRVDLFVQVLLSFSESAVCVSPDFVDLLASTTDTVSC
jgi:hypothetical protein